MKIAPVLMPFLTTSFAAVVLSTASCVSPLRDTSSGSVGTELLSRTRKNPPATTKVACDACGGMWGAHGIASVESCICPTQDAGHSCTDGQQCEGMCIVRDDAFQITEPGEPPKGYYVGHCADYEATFGCYSVVPPGTVERGPHVVGEGIENICVD